MESVVIMMYVSDGNGSAEPPDKYGHNSGEAVRDEFAPVGQIRVTRVHIHPGHVHMHCTAMSGHHLLVCQTKER